MRVNNLKGIAVFDIFLAAQHIFIILLTALVTGELAQLSLHRLLRLHRLQQHFLHRRNFALCFSVIDGSIIRFDIHNQENLLLEMVKGNQLIEQHQIDIGKFRLALFIYPHIRLAVAHKIKAKGANKTAGKIRQAFNLRCLVFLQNMADAAQGIIFLILHGSTADDFRIAVGYFQTQHRIIAHKGITRPVLTALNAFQKEIITAAASYIVQKCQRRQHIRQAFLRYRHSLVVLCILHDLLQR